MNLNENAGLYLAELKKAIDGLEKEKILKLVEKVQSLIGTKRTFFVCGNGGSAATSSHIACDFGKTVLGKNPREKNKRLKVISLNDCIPTMTAWGNDEGYEYIFSEQLRSLGSKGDFLLVITGSGNSSNILNIIETAKNLGIETFGLLGFSGGKAKDMLDDYLIVDSDNYGIIEDVHGIVNHLMTDCLKIK
jgi:D-sedoheptulose 7-phosphate isomerase